MTKIYEVDHAGSTALVRECEVKQYVTFKFSSLNVKTKSLALVCLNREGLLKETGDANFV